MLAEQNGAIFLRRQVEWPGAAVVQHDAQFRLGEQLEEVRARRFEADFQHVVGHCLDLVDHAQLDLEVVAAGAAYRPLAPLRDLLGDRKSVVEGQSVSVRVTLGVRRIIKKKKESNKAE